jgi:Spy/CpxP family protein refolding chaperone
MKSENNYSLKVWTIVILAALNISTLATIIYNRYELSKTETLSQSDPKQSELISEKFSGRYFRDQLSLSRDQMDEFIIINPVFRQKAHSITVGLALKRKQMLSEMSAVQSDTLRLNALSDSIGLLHSNLKKVTYKYYLDIKNICDPEQQQKLEQIFSEMFSNDSPIGHPGIGGTKGRQQGRRFNN